jgi:phage terminase Nu1 subunit (DNA packaging protein)
MGSDKPTVRRDVLLNARQCSEAIGISYNAFSKWGVPVHSEEGRQKLFLLKDVLEVYRRRIERELRPAIERELRAEAAGAMDGELDPFLIKAQLDKQRTRLTDAQAEHQEMKNQMMRHEIAPFSFFTFVLGRAANGIASVMDGLPSELVRRLSLKPQQVDKVRAVTAAASEAIAALGDEEWVAARYDEYLAETDQ